MSLAECHPETIGQGIWKNYPDTIDSVDEATQLLSEAVRHEKACRRKKAKESKRHSDAEDEFERAMKAFNLAKSLLDKAEQAVDVAARLHHNAEIHKFRIIDILRQSGFSLSTDFLSPRSNPIVLRTTPNEIQMVEVAVHLD